MLFNSRNLRILKDTPKPYVGSEVENIARILNAAYIIFPSFLAIVLIRQFLQSDYDMAILISVGILIALGIRQLFLKGELQKSVMSVAIFFTLLLTIVCSLGNGIHDIGLIGFPIIIGFSSVILEQKQLILASILSVLGLTWLVTGEMYNLFTPLLVTSGTAGDFIISSLLISIGGFVAFSLTRNIKNSLNSANREIEVSKSEANLLADQIDQKEEIIEEIHRAVINSLGHITHLIEHNPKDNDELILVYESLRRKIIVIESAHGILLADRAPIILDIKELTREILNRYEKKLTTPVIHIDIDKGTCNVSLDQAIHYGIFLIELVHLVDHHCSESFRISLSMVNDQIVLNLKGFDNVSPENFSVVIDLLTKQLKGKLNISDHEIKLSFSPGMHK